MKRAYITTFAACLIVILAFAGIYRPWTHTAREGVLKVGFLYENDESTMYTHNFALAQQALEKAYGDAIQIVTRSNVQEAETAEPLQALAHEGCGIIFVYSYSDQVMEVAQAYPETQFCQVSRQDTAGVACPDNYHTFNAEIYEGRYVTGIAAGMKLQEMIKNGAVKAEEASVGFVGAFENPETISAYTAFLLGVRSVVPEATLKVKYVNAWVSYSREKAAAEALIQAGCRIIAQHTHTLGPAMACEEAALQNVPVYHVGQDQSLVDVIPVSSLISARIDWSHYVLSAVQAVMTRRSIEGSVDANVHGNDVSAGFDRNWIEILELNRQNVAEGTQQAVNAAVEAMKKGNTDIFKGAFTGTDPQNPSDTIDLSGGYTENANSSSPTFHYVLDGVVEVL